LISTRFFDNLHGAMKSFPASRFFLPPLLLILTSVGGCSFFEYVGDSISDGYQNTVAYFNSYYNARRAFDDAEAEIVGAEQLSGIRGFTDKPPQVQSSVRQKLTTVIDKCSNILQFYPSSALVDDALMLIGKSYYYQAEYLKAERKFTEFFSGYPDSPLNREARLWYVRTLARLKKDDQAVESGMALLAEAEQDEDSDVAAAVTDILGVVHERGNRHEKSLEMYARLRDITEDDEMRAWAYYREGEKLNGLRRHEEAAEMFRLAADNSANAQFKCRSLLEHIRTLRSLERLDDALRVSDAMLDDFQFAQNTKEILFERGKTFGQAGRIDEAVDDLVKVDTTAARTELGSRASFELAKLYEHERADYRQARDSYQRSTTFPVAEFIAEGRRKQMGFTRYFSLTSLRGKTDSLLADVAAPDSLPADSATARAPRLSPDSLRSVLAENSFELAELFYVDIENPDSALFWYREALKGIDDTVRTPRIKYVMAELALSNPDRGFGNGEELLQSIIDDYPKSVYAMRSKIQLGVPVESSGPDESEVLYKRAEATIDSGDYGQAITVLKKISTEYPLSPFAAKSVYTVGWIYEHRLSQPDSALSQYKALVQTYAGSPYAAVVRPKVLARKVSDADSSAKSVQEKEKTVKKKEQ